MKNAIKVLVIIEAILIVIEMILSHLIQTMPKGLTSLFSSHISAGLVLFFLAYCVLGIILSLFPTIIILFIVNIANKKNSNNENKSIS